MDIGQIWTWSFRTFQFFFSAKCRRADPNENPGRNLGWIHWGQQLARFGDVGLTTLALIGAEPISIDLALNACTRVTRVFHFSGHRRLPRERYHIYTTDTWNCVTEDLTKIMFFLWTFSRLSLCWLLLRLLFLRGDFVCWRVEVDPCLFVDVWTSCMTVDETVSIFLVPSFSARLNYGVVARAC
jgi:hypothetical protein